MTTHDEPEAPEILPDKPVECLLRHYPRLAEIFVRRRLHCVGCTLAAFHNLADVARIYHVDPVILVREINCALDEQDNMRGK